MLTRRRRRPLPTGRASPGLATRFFLATAAVVLASLGVTVLVVTTRANQVAGRTIRADLKAVPSIFGAWEADLHSRIRAQVRSLAGEPGTKALLDPGVSATTRWEFVATDAVQVLDAGTVFLFDREGRVLARSDRPLGEGVGQPFGAVRWVADPLESWDDASASIIEEGVLSYVAAAPVISGADQFVRLDGVLAASFPLGAEAAAAVQGLTRGQVAFLVNRARRGEEPRIAVSRGTPAFPGEEFLAAFAAHPVAMDAVFRRAVPSEAFEFSLAGGPVLGLALPIISAAGEPYGAVVVLRSLDEELAPFREIIRTIVIVGLAVLLGAAPLAFALGRRLARPIRQLAAGAASVREGHLDMTLPSAGTDEVGRLAAAFQEMVAELKEKRALEALVAPLSRRAPTLAPHPDGPSPATWGVGETLAGRYRLERLLGRGGMAAVYLARDLELDEDIAVKILTPQAFADGTQAVQTVKQEIRLARRISHPNVVRVHDLGDAGGVRFLTMEHVPGLTLRQVVDQEGPIALSAGLQIAKQACRGLAAIHDAGILHRDIKPQNIMVLPSGLVKLMDFGIAQAQARVAATDEVAGTPSYISPEQLQGAQADARSDLYALGATFYEMFAGRPPFTGTVQEVLTKHVHEFPAPLSRLRPGMPAMLERIILLCLAKRPDQRPASAHDLYQELLRISATVAADGLGEAGGR